VDSAEVERTPMYLLGDDLDLQMSRSHHPARPLDRHIRTRTATSLRVLEGPNAGRFSRERTGQPTSSCSSAGTMVMVLAARRRERPSMPQLRVCHMGGTAQSRLTRVSGCKYARLLLRVGWVCEMR
jgi:hypothetical protein